MPPDDLTKNVSTRASLFQLISVDCYFEKKKINKHHFLLEVNQEVLVDHAAMAVDFKGEGLKTNYSFFSFVPIVSLSFSYFHVCVLTALTFKATTDGVIRNLVFCIELMQKREETWRLKYEKVTHTTQTKMEEN